MALYLVIRPDDQPDVAFSPADAQPVDSIAAAKAIVARAPIGYAFIYESAERPVPGMVFDVNAIVEVYDVHTNQWFPPTFGLMRGE